MTATVIAMYLLLLQQLLLAEHQPRTAPMLATRYEIGNDIVSTLVMGKLRLREVVLLAQG